MSIRSAILKASSNSTPRYGSKVCDLIFGRRLIAANCANGWFLIRVTTTKLYAIAAISLLRARAAGKSSIQNGLSTDLRCSDHEGPVLDEPPFAALRMNW